MMDEQQQQQMRGVVLTGEAAEQRGVQVRTIERWIKAGGLAAKEAS